MLESGHRAVEGKHSHNDEKADEDEEASPCEHAPLRFYR